MGDNEKPPPRFKELYKQQQPANRDVRHRRLVHEAQLRRLQREQVFMDKRLRYRQPQESETESEYEFTPSDTKQIIIGLKASATNISQLGVVARHDERVGALKNLSTKLEQPSEELRRFVLEGSCMELLTKFFSATDADEKLHSLWCLTNIAANEGRLAEKVLPAAPYLLSLVTSDNMELQNQAAWALGNLAAEGEKTRETLHANGVLKPLVDLLGSTADEAILQTACFAVSNMARKPNTYFDELFALKLPQLAAKQLVAFKEHQHCVTELAWVFAYLAASSSEQQIDEILATGAIDTLLQSALNTAKAEAPGAALIPVIRTLGNIAAGTDDQTSSLVGKNGFVGLLVRCIESTSSRAVEKEALWALSCVTASRKADVDAVVDAGVVPDLVRIIEKQNFDIKKEAAFGLLNIAIIGGRAADLPNERLIAEFVEFIKSQDEELVRMGVQYIAIVFEQLPDSKGPELLKGVAGGIDALENLIAVTHDDDTRSLLSVLIDQYYGEDTMEVED
ncbi:hypothetical protein GGI09_003320 [Coemansia sp. S100]|nr:hypothetical protein GGI09_003320 [Coemansia sp. S100]